MEVKDNIDEENSKKDNVQDILNSIRSSSLYQENANQDSRLLQSISYTLTQQEAYQCLKRSKIIKTVGTRAVLFTIILSIAAIGFFVSYFVQKNINNLVFALLSLLVIAVIWVFPTIHLKKLAKANADKRTICADIYTDRIDIGKDDKKWTIDLDNSNRFKIYGDILLFYTTQEGQYFVIPLRVIDAENREKIISIIKQGTLLYQE